MFETFERTHYIYNNIHRSFCSGIDFIFPFKKEEPKVQVVLRSHNVIFTRIISSDSSGCSLCAKRENRDSSELTHDDYSATHLV